MTIIIFGYYGFGNAGDEAILAAIVARFREQSPGIRIVVASGSPKKTAALCNVEAIPWNEVAGLDAAISSADLVVIGGGGLFHDYWGADPDTVLTDAHWGIAYYCSCAFLATLRRKPLMIYAVGVGPLVSDYGVRLTRAICDAAQLITVRDPESKRLLESIGVGADKIVVTADPAWSFASGAVVARQTGAKPVLAVAARKWTIGVHSDFLERELARALDLFIAGTGGSTVLFPFQELEGEVENDRATAERIVGHMRHRDNATVSRAALAPDQIIAAFAGCDVVLGMRLHALIFAAIACVPAVALSYDPKIDAVERFLGRGEGVIDVRGFDAAELCRRLLDALGAGPAPKPQADTSRDAALALELLKQFRPAIRFSEDALDLLRRGIAAQLKRTENQRQLEAAIPELQESIATAEREVFDLNGKLDHEDEIRRAALAEIERYRSKLETDIASYRSQRAWQAMLLFRKAYTLLTRGSKLNFLKWAMGAAVGRWGSLAEYDLPFSDIGDYLPALFVRKNAGVLSTTSTEVPFPRDRYDVLILGIIDFDFRFQRPQQIAAEFARRGHRVFWISPSRFLPPHSKDAYEIVPIRENIWEVRIRCAPADVYLGELSDAHAQEMGTSLTELCRDWGIASSIVAAQLPFWRRLALQLRERRGSKILYDCMDDWETFQNMGAFNVAEEKRFVQECDVLVVTGAELRDKYMAQKLKPVLVRNGVDYDFYASTPHNPLLHDIPKPIVGYFGAIADWIDLDLVREVAERRPQYSFVLIGQVFGRDVSALESLPNVWLLGNKRYEDLPYYLQSFDACLIPFLINQVTKATDPVKLYEYFSLGKPVVATDMAELQQCGDLVYIGRNVDEYCEKLDEAVSDHDGQFVAPRIAFAEANTWKMRVDQIDENVRPLFPLVSILIVTYKSEEFVRPCLDSIFRNTSYTRYEVVVVDNASTDATFRIVEDYGDRVKAIRLPENTGFAAGNNRAASEAQGEYLLFLNVDTVVTPGWIHKLVRHIERDKRIGLICPVTNFAGNEIKINFDYTTPSEMESFAAAISRANDGRAIDIGVAPLFCALMPRRAWDTAGELDTSFGMGMFEDDDLSMRVRTAGLRVVAAEDCFVHHFGQGSFSKLPADSYHRLFDQNRKRFEEKWRKPWIAHRPRHGVRPVQEDKRFQPATFR